MSAPAQRRGGLGEQELTRGDAQVGDLSAASADLATAACLLAKDDSDLEALRKQMAEAQAVSFSVGVEKMMQGEHREALSQLQTGIDAAEAAGALKVVAHGYSYMGIAHQQLGNFSQAIKCHERHLHLAEGLADADERVRALSNLSSAHQLNGDHQQAIAFHTQQLELVTDSTPPADLCSLYGNMSRAYLSAGQLNKALEYQERCFQIATNLDNDEMRAKALSNLGQTLSAMGRENEALVAHRKSLLLSQADEDEVACARQLESIARLQQSQGEHRKALRSFDRVLGTLEKYHDGGAQVARVRCRKALSLHALGDSAQAIEMLKDGMAVSRGAGDKEEEAYVLQQLGLLYVSQSDADKAVQCHARELKLRRELTAQSGCARAPAAATVPAPAAGPASPPRQVDGARAAHGACGQGSQGREDGAGRRGGAEESLPHEKMLGDDSDGCAHHSSAGIASAHKSAENAARRELEAGMALGAALSLAGRHREAIFHYTAALRRAQQTRDVLEQGVLMVSIGAVLLQEGSEKFAAAAFRQGLEFLEENAGDLTASSFESAGAADDGKAFEADASADLSNRRNRLFSALARALRGLQMVHVQHHESYHSPSAAAPSNSANPVDGDESTSDTSSTRTAGSSRASSATSTGAGAPRDNSDRVPATVASAAVAAKEALVCALQLQALEQVVALGDQRVLEWEEVEDDLDLRSLTFKDVRDVVRLSGSGLVVLSLLDREGTLVAWVVPPDGGNGINSVKMILMEQRHLLSRIAQDWCDVPALLSRATGGARAQQACDPPGASAATANDGSDGGRNDAQQGRNSAEEPVGELGESELFRLLYDICWAQLAQHVADWEHVRIVPHGELLLVPWGALLDSSMSPLSSRHIISVEPCLKGLIYLLNNLAPQDGASAGVEPRRGPVAVSVDKVLSRVRAAAPAGAALVVSDPYNAQHVRRSAQDLAQEREDRKEEAELGRICVPLRVPPGGFDAVQEALDNPPPGGWLPRAVSGKGASAASAADNVPEGASEEGRDAGGAARGTADTSRSGVGIRGEAAGASSVGVQEPVGVRGHPVSGEVKGVTAALRAMGMEVTSLAKERASPRMVMDACKEAGWIHLAVPLVGGDPHRSDWVHGSGRGKGSASRGAEHKTGHLKDEPAGRYDEMELVLADGETADGERDWGYVTARRLADWRGKFAGATVVVAGRPQGQVTLDGAGNSPATSASTVGKEGVEGGEEGASDGQEDAALDGPERRLLKRAATREHGRAPAGVMGHGPLTSRCVQVWLAMVGALRLSCGAQVLMPLRVCVAVGVWVPCAEGEGAKLLGQMLGIAGLRE